MNRVEAVLYVHMEASSAFWVSVEKALLCVFCYIALFNKLLKMAISQNSRDTIYIQYMQFVYVNNNISVILLHSS